jgi:hypothetical protein
MMGYQHRGGHPHQTTPALKQTTIRQPVERELRQGQYVNDNRSGVQRTLNAPISRVRAQDALALQRTAGNRATQQLLSAKAEAPAKPPQPIVRQRVSAAKAPIQRMMVRMPYRQGGGTLHAVGEAEIDEMEEAMTQKGRAGKGGKHNWESQAWKFQSGEVNYFYGHGNRMAFGELTAGEFVTEALKPNRTLPLEAAIKFVACGGGEGQNYTTAYGQQVSKYLIMKPRERLSVLPEQQNNIEVLEESKSKESTSKESDSSKDDDTSSSDDKTQEPPWRGALKATEGLLFQTKNYKMVIPDFPEGVEDFTKVLADKADNHIRQKLWNNITHLVEQVQPPKARATALKEVLGKQAGIPEQISNKRISTVKDYLDKAFKGKDLLTIVATLEQLNVSQENPIGNNLKAAAVKAHLKIKKHGKRIWDEFKEQLKEKQLQKDPNRVKTGGQRIGMKGDQGDEDDPFTTYKDYGPTTWRTWKDIKRGPDLSLLPQWMDEIENGLGNNANPPGNENVNPVQNPNPPNPIQFNIPNIQIDGFDFVLDVTDMDLGDAF